MHLEIITPEKKIFAGEVTAVQFPGLDGSFQVLNDHAPIISSLSEGEVKVDLTSSFENTGKLDELLSVDPSNNKVIRVKVKGGVVEMQNNKVIVLAE
ncbi:MAG: F0F1 ATP synthase subunit epsilon [Crocinitomicaceae bacterium]